MLHDGMPLPVACWGKVYYRNGRHVNVFCSYCLETPNLPSRFLSQNLERARPHISAEN